GGAREAARGAGRSTETAGSTATTEPTFVRTGLNESPAAAMLVLARIQWHAKQCSSMAHPSSVWNVLASTDAKRKLEATTKAANERTVWRRQAIMRWTAGYAGPGGPSTNRPNLVGKFMI